MKFSNLAKYLEKLESTSSRLEITQILADLFKKASASEIDKIIYLLLGGLAARYEQIVFNLSEKLTLQAVAQAFNIDPQKVRQIYKQKGDLGNVAQSLAKSSGKNLSTQEVFEALKNIALDEGQGSQERKISATAKLLSHLDPLSARFVARIPVGKLRLGFSDKTILDALSWMETGDKSAKADLDQAYHVLPDVGLLAQNVKKHGIKKATSNIKPIVGTPILPMLPQRLKSPAEVIAKMGKVAIEPKFDGLRIQLHYSKNKFIKAFTRNLNETSWMFPELEKANHQIKARSAILDCEAIGLDKNTMNMVNFQATMTRRRKHEVQKHSQEIPIRFQVFDILSLNNKNLLNKNYLERRKILQATIKKNKLLVIDDYLITKEPSVIAQEHALWLKKGLEGVIVKKVDSLYVPGRTGWRWIKMKEEVGKYAKLADTVDCVVMGYSRGKGKRATFGIGLFLAGIRNGEKIKSITKVGTGLTDAQFKELKKLLTPLETKKRPKKYQVNKNLEPDVWVTPNLVVELAADEITVSPSHTSGFALRFPRLIKFRPDKSVNEITTLKEIKHLYKLQKS